MIGLPFYNDALSVEAVGFEPFGDERLGVLITPWFMNLMLIADLAIPYSECSNGQKRRVDLPGGEESFLCGGTEEFGMFYARSLASPMDVYRSQDQVRAAARMALARALSPPPTESAPVAASTQPAMSRRTLFTFAGRPLQADPPG
jgi:[NiFe] hydrogenase assembly HybE family chaperone